MARYFEQKSKKKTQITNLLQTAENKIKKVISKELKEIGKKKIKTIISGVNSDKKRSLKDLKIDTKKYEQNLVESVTPYLKRAEELAVEEVSSPTRNYEAEGVIKKIVNFFKFAKKEIRSVFDYVYQGKLSKEELEIVRPKALLITTATTNDLDKIMYGIYSSSFGKKIKSNDLKKQLGEELDLYTTGSSVAGSATLYGAEVINNGRVNVFKKIENEIESYTVLNNAPKTDFCQAINGKTIPLKEIDSYIPPYHWRCKSFIVPNMKSWNGNPEASLPSFTKDELDSASLLL